MFVPLREWLDLPIARGLAMFAAAVGLAGWSWLFLRLRRMEAEMESTRQALASALERERARGELVLGRRDTLAVLGDLRRLAVRMRGANAEGVGDGAGRRDGTR